MRKLDRTRDFATVYGGEAKYTQDGIDFDAAGNEMVLSSHVEDDLIIPTDNLDAAEAFLRNVLRNPLSKATVFRAAESNNQDWKEVKSAAERLKIIKFKYNGAETWKLPEEI